MKWLTDLWHTDWVVINVNKKFVIMLMLVYGLFWLKNYVWMQGAVAAYQYMQQNPVVPDDTSTGEVGRFDHSKDTPKDI